MKNPLEVSKTDLIDVVRRVQQALWPRGNREHEWSPDTLDEISGAMLNAGLGPLKPERDV